MPRMPRPMGNLFIGILLWHIATNHTHEDSSSAVFVGLWIADQDPLIRELLSHWVSFRSCVWRS